MIDKLLMYAGGIILIVVFAISLSLTYIFTVLLMVWFGLKATCKKAVELIPADYDKL